MAHVHAEERIGKIDRDGQKAKGPHSTILSYASQRVEVFRKQRIPNEWTRDPWIRGETLDPLRQRRATQALVRHYSAPTEGAVSSVVCGGRFPAACQMCVVGLRETRSFTGAPAD